MYTYSEINFIITYYKYGLGCRGLGFFGFLGCLGFVGFVGFCF